MPYITASIIFQLLTVIYEPLAKLQKEGELGRRKITQWTRYVTVLLGVIQSFAIALTLTSSSAASAGTAIRAAASSLMRHHADGRHGLHHVAGRADHRARHRKRHVAAHLYRHRGRPAARHRGPLSEGADAPWGCSPPGAHPPGRRNGGRGCVHRLRGTLRAPHPGAVRQAHRRTQDDGRPVHPPSAAGQLRRRDADHLRQFHPFGAAAVWA